MIDDQHREGSSVSARKVKKRIACWFIVFVNIASSTVICPLGTLEPLVGFNSGLKTEQFHEE